MPNSISSSACFLSTSFGTGPTALFCAFTFVRPSSVERLELYESPEEYQHVESHFRGYVLLLNKDDKENYIFALVLHIPGMS